MSTWTIRNLGGVLDIMDGGLRVAGMARPEKDPNAERLVACHNALEGLDPDALGEALTALDNAADPAVPRDFVQVLAIKALAKLRR